MTESPSCKSKKCSCKNNKTVFIINSILIKKLINKLNEEKMIYSKKLIIYIRYDRDIDA